MVNTDDRPIQGFGTEAAHGPLGRLDRFLHLSPSWKSVGKWL
jgi:hypothetical protein